MQVAFFDPGVVGNIFFNANGQDFRIRGIETSFVARVMTGLTLQGGVAWNQSEQTNSPILLNNNPNSANYGQPITTACNAFGANCVTGNPYLNPFGQSGSPSANSPPMQFAVRARYEWNISTYRPYVQFGATHSDHSYTQAGSNPALGPGTITTGRLRFENPLLFDLRGVDRGGEGCLVVQPLLRKLQQLKQEHLHQHRPVHRRADAAEAAGHRWGLWL